MFKIVQESTTGVVQTFGKFTRLVNPGFRIYVPFIQSITPVSNRLRQDNFECQTKTKDNAFAAISVSVQYRVLPKDSAISIFSLYDHTKQISAYIENDIRALVPKINLDELFESQDVIGKNVMDNLSEKMKEYGYTMVNTLITNIEPSSDVKNAMNSIVASERLKQAVINEADANYIKEIKQAESDRERKKLQGQGISEQRKAILEGYKNGMDDMAKSLGLSPQDIIEFVMRTQHLDTLESIGKSPNTKTIFINHDEHRTRNQIMSALENTKNTTDL